MAPEQITGGEITPQVDLYATGLLAYELLAGRHPFHGTDAPMALLMHHVNDEPPPLASVRPDLPAGVVAWVHAMLAKYPAARPAGAAAAWDRLEGVVSDALGPRWRRDATITEPAVDPGRADRGRARAAERAVRDLPGRGAVAADAGPGRPRPHPRRPRRCGPSRSASSPRARRPGAAAAGVPPRRSRPVVAACGGAPSCSLWPGRLILAIAAILYSTAPGEEPRAAPRPPAGPSLEPPLREAVTPAVRADGRVSRELSSLVPGASPDDALDRVGAALAATGRARTAVDGLGASTADDRLLRARRAARSSTQAEYLGAVRATLRLRVDDDRLDALAARLVARLELIETAVPDASESVDGVQPLQRWLDAEIAAQPPAFAPPATAKVNRASCRTPSPPRRRRRRGPRRRRADRGARADRRAPRLRRRGRNAAVPAPPRAPEAAPPATGARAALGRRERLHEVAQLLSGIAAQDGPVPEARMVRPERRELVLRPPVLRRVDREQRAAAGAGRGPWSAGAC